MAISVGAYSLCCGLTRLRELRPSELYPTSLGALKSVPRSRRDHRALLLRQGCEQMQDEGVNVGAKLGNDELHALGHQTGDEMNVAAEPVEFGHHNRAFATPRIAETL